MSYLVNIAKCISHLEEWINMINEKIAVTSRSFSLNKTLRMELEEQYQYVKYNDLGLKFDGEQLIQFLSGCTKAIIGLEKLNDEILSRLPTLKTISRFGVGLDGIDFSILAKHSVKLSMVPGVNKTAVAELTLLYMLMLMRNTYQLHIQLKNGGWKKTTGFELNGKTIGIIGANHIGQEVIRLLKPFNCKILIYDIADLTTYCKEHGTLQLNFDELVKQADIISLHIPLTKYTRRMINASVLNKMKPTAYLINTSRGAIVDQTALKLALINNKIAGAALDVFEHEPCEDLELLMLPNLICTPHIAGNSAESELAMGRAAIAGLENAKLPEFIPS